MKLQGHTILITGGSSGIGLELARQLISKNTIIICGRSVQKLEDAKTLLPDVVVFRCDISDKAEREALFKYLKEHHPSCDILINNAAVVHRSCFHLDADIIEKAELEINTNLLAPIALSKMFLMADQRPNAIINITTGLVFAPRAVYPIYNATKAALHSFTQVLRFQMKDTQTRIIEVMMPAVDTPWHKGAPPRIAISPEKAVIEMIAEIEKGKYEIKVGGVKILYALSRIFPAFTFKKINQMT
jgi:uncharacterized oxidoreductase